MNNILKGWHISRSAIFQNNPVKPLKMFKLIQRIRIKK